MDNQAYLESLHVPALNMQKCLDAMEKYGENHWWEPDVDPRKCAYYQIHEPVLLCAFSGYHEAIELLLGRSVYTHELGISADKLMLEAERAWAYQVGVTSEVERQERIAESIDNLHEYAKKNEKQVISIQLPGES